MTDEEVHLLEDAFADGFRGAADKLAFLRLARIPNELARPDGPGLKLVEVRFEERHTVGAASPGFGTRELVHHPLPGRLIRASTRLVFRYVSADGPTDLSLVEVLERAGLEPRPAAPADGHRHDHAHGHSHDHSHSHSHDHGPAHGHHHGH